MTKWNTRGFGCALLAGALSLGACEGEPVLPQRPEGTDVEIMNTAIAELQARAEHDAERVTVQHVLLSFEGCGTRATRRRELAELLAAEVYCDAVFEGADFEGLMGKHSDDSGGGTYTMVAAGVPATDGASSRDGMVPAFGDVGWRLEVGQIGVAPHDVAKSKFGWHVVKRIK